jgi:hypothetical protein
MEGPVLKLPEMRALVQKELEHIPRGPLSQNMLRANYWLGRMSSLGKKAEGATDALGVLNACIEEVKKHYPSFIAQYDRAFFEGIAEVEYYVCKIVPKGLDEDHKSVMRTGHQLLKLRNCEAEKRVGPIVFEGTPWERFPAVLLDLINGNDSRSATVRFARTDYSIAGLIEILRSYFPKRLVKDVTIDGKSIFAES